MPKNDLDDDLDGHPDLPDEEDLEELAGDEEEPDLDEDDDELDADAGAGAEHEDLGDGAPAAVEAKDGHDDEDDDDEDDDDDDVEASLDVILKERMVVSDDDGEDDDDEEVGDSDERGDSPIRVLPKQPGEFVCQSCFLVKHQSQLADPDKALCRDCV